MKNETDKLNCLIIDDKTLAIDLLETFAVKSKKFNQILKTNQPENGLALLKNNNIDILFLDIQMPQMTGIELIKIIPYKPSIIFTTAYANYGSIAFDLDVTDYLLKPFSYERFLKSVEKAQLQIKSTQLKDPDFITIKSDGLFHKINLTDIIFIEGKKDYVKFHCKSNITYTTLQNLSSLEDKLIEFSFLRIHKSYIISTFNIAKYNNNEVILNNGIALPISRMKKMEVINVLKELNY